jgi:peptide-methionine (S)-S-oxide reductase
MSDTTAKAILAGGCFWGMQDLIRKHGLVHGDMGERSDTRQIPNGPDSRGDAHALIGYERKRGWVQTDGVHSE